MDAVDVRRRSSTATEARGGDKLDVLELQRVHEGSWSVGASSSSWRGAVGAARRVAVVGAPGRRGVGQGHGGPGKGLARRSQVTRERGGARARLHSAGQRGSERRGEDMGKPAGTSWRSRARHGRHCRVPDDWMLQTQRSWYYGAHQIKANTNKQEIINVATLCRIKFSENKKCSRCSMKC